MARKKKFTIQLKIIRIDKSGCHISVAGKVNGKKAHLIIDTGASQTVFDKHRIEKFIGHNDFEKVETLSTGLGTNTMESHLVKITNMHIGNMEFKNRKVVLLDLTHVNQSFEMMNMKPIDGVIGGDFLKSNKAIIDYGKKVLILTR